MRPSSSMILRSIAFAAFAAASSGAPGADATLSGAAVRDSVQASGHASASAAHAIAASGRATLGVLAIPLGISGTVSAAAGAASTAAAMDSARAANLPIGTPLEITDETITVTPPDQALRAAPPPLPAQGRRE
ncbi:MAG: hypothetical protein HY854_15255 [Burkholderiales bacterium]|nr:hypothetical protein [Burkholderiales bacterium]